MTRPALLLPGLTAPPSYDRPAVKAHHSPDLSRRYALTAWWGEESAPRLHWLMLNPSIAGLCQTPDNLDPTLRRVRGFTRAAGFSGFTVLNLYSLVSTDPKGLAGEDPGDLYHEGPALDWLTGVDRLVCAWGSNAKAPPRARKLLHHLPTDTLCLRTTKDGWPQHPLYLPSDLTLTPWAMP